MGCALPFAARIHPLPRSHQQPLFLQAALSLQRAFPPHPACAASFSKANSYSPAESPPLTTPQLGSGAGFHPRHSWKAPKHDRKAHDVGWSRCSARAETGRRAVVLAAAAEAAVVATWVASVVAVVARREASVAAVTDFDRYSPRRIRGGGPVGRRLRARHGECRPGRGGCSE